MIALCAVVLLGAIGWRLACALVPVDDRAVRAALALVLGAALLCTGYGLLGQLSARRAADVELVFHGDPVAAPASSTSAGAGEVRVIDDRVTVPRATPRGLLVFAGLCALTFLGVARPRQRPLSRHDAPAWTHLLWIPIALSGLGALISVPRGYDALWYHLPMAAAFADNGHLEPPGRDLVFYFPGNLELLARTLRDVLGPWLGARAMALVQLPFALALAPLATAIARRLGAGRSSFFAGALMIGAPMVVFQAGLGYADVVALAALAAALLLLLDGLRARGGRAIALPIAAGAGLGLALGAKYAALPLVLSGLPIFAACALGGRPWRRALPRALGLSALVLVGLVAPAWFWYARNLRLSGNPIFPIAVPSLGWRGLFAAAAFNRDKELELVGARVQWLAYPWLEGLSHESGFGAAFATLVPLSLPTLVRAAFRRRRPRLIFPFAWGIAYLIAWWLGTPHEVRHLLPLLLLLGAPAVVLLRGASATAQGLRGATCAALALGALITLRLQLFSPAPELSVRGLDFEALYGLPPAVLAALPPGARVANLGGRPYNLALLGPDLRLRLDDYAPGTPSEAALRDRGATHVFVRQPAARVAPPTDHLTLLYRHEVPARSGWAFWDATPTDIVSLYALEELACDKKSR